MADGLVRLTDAKLVQLAGVPEACGLVPQLAALKKVRGGCSACARRRYAPQLAAAGAAIAGLNPAGRARIKALLGAGRVVVGFRDPQGRPAELGF